MPELTLRQAQAELRRRGFSASRANVKLWASRGAHGKARGFPGARLAETPRGPVYYVPLSDLELYEERPAGRGRRRESGGKDSDATE